MPFDSSCFSSSLRQDVEAALLAAGGQVAHLHDGVRINKLYSLLVGEAVGLGGVLLAQVLLSLPQARRDPLFLCFLLLSDAILLATHDPASWRY